MDRPARVRRALSLLPAVAYLAGCAGGSTPPLSALSPAFVSAMRPDAQHYGNDVYSTSPGTNQATVYRRKGTKLKLSKTLSLDLASPEGTVATPSGWWYVANANAQNVLIYRPTSKGPKLATPLADSGALPVDVAVTPNRKLVAVSNAATTKTGGGNVSVYLDGVTEPSGTLTYGKDVLGGAGVAIDPQGNCYWSFSDISDPSKLGSIVEFAQCAGSGTTVVSGITVPGGLAFDGSGNLYYIDEASGIYKCQTASNCVLFATGFGKAISLNFDAGYKDLWVADAGGYLDAVNPQTGEIESQTAVTGGFPYGIAPSPGS